MTLRLGKRLTERWLGLRLPGRTIRLRLTLLYGGLFLASGAALLAITYVLVRQATGDVLVGKKPNGSTVVISGKGAGAGAAKHGTKPSVERRLKGAPPGIHLTAQQLRAQARRDRELAERQHAAELRQLLEQSGVALAIMTAISIGLGWLVAGRVLRPLRTITTAARAISASNLHRRLALEGPDDELTRLGDTFDGLLERLEAAFAAQRQFAANASHELRTPITFERTLLEVALADPNTSAQTLRRTCEQLLANSEQQERLIEALLTFSRSQRGLDQREPVDLAAITKAALDVLQPEAQRRRLEVHATLERALTAGDPRLIARLVTNLVDNALHHNIPHGRVEVSTATHDGYAVVAVANTGLSVPSEELDRLFLPFQRLGADRTGQGKGVGLGLSIVSAIATAHDARLTSRARPDGGLEVQVAFASNRQPALGRGADNEIETLTHQ